MDLGRRVERRTGRIDGDVAAEPAKEEAKKVSSGGTKSKSLVYSNKPATTSYTTWEVNSDPKYFTRRGKLSKRTTIFAARTSILTVPSGV